MKNSRFLKVECPECGKAQIIFNKPAGKVKCNSCAKTIAKSTGGKGKILGKIQQILS